MIRPWLQLIPLSVVFENIAGPRNAGASPNAAGLACSFAETRRSHTAAGPS